MKRPTTTQLKNDILRGIRTLSDHPCSICRAGYGFADFPHFHGSDFGKCPLQVQHEKLSGIREAFDDLTCAFLYDGHVHEATLVAGLRAADYKVDHRLDAPEGENTDEKVIIFRGRWLKDIEITDYESIDFDNPPNGIVVVIHTDGVINDRWLLECKAVKDWAFDKCYRKNKIQPKYERQMKIYMTALDLEGGYLVVKSRHNSEVLTFWVPRDDDYVYQRVRLFKKMLEASNQKKWIACDPPDEADTRFCKTCRIKDKLHGRNK